MLTLEIWILFKKNSNNIQIMEVTFLVYLQLDVTKKYIIFIFNNYNNYI